MRGKLTEHFRRDSLAVEALLQRIERLHVALAHDQQLSIDRTVEIERLREIRKAVRDVLAGTRIEPSNTFAILARPCCSLHADAVPLPFRDKLRRIEPPKLAFLERMGEHDRPERRQVAGGRFVRAAFEPGK